MHQKCLMTIGAVLLCMLLPSRGTHRRCEVASFRTLLSRSDPCVVKLARRTPLPDWINNLDFLDSLTSASDEQLDDLAKVVCACRLFRVHRSCPNSVYELVTDVAWRCIPGARESVMARITNAVEQHRNGTKYAVDEEIPLGREVDSHEVEIVHGERTKDIFPDRQRISPEEDDGEPGEVTKGELDDAPTTKMYGRTLEEQLTDYSTSIDGSGTTEQSDAYFATTTTVYETDGTEDSVTQNYAAFGTNNPMKLGFTPADMVDENNQDYSETEETGTSRTATNVYVTTGSLPVTNDG
ncbi:uncharacterized protein LOC108676340 [Hyalella azteca]|uniref:Uncharacterized protein LOC108676340 n=1 Tax=Hyalella azteca TaxID=294128 RepID=A0A8B7P1D0_HYAAZ|nr:uncharacterized protein LOC108676340 [Hyalella azteca]